MAEKWNRLPQTTKLAVYGGSGAAGAILLAAFLFFCCRQRRAGRLEREAYNNNIEKEREAAYKDQMELNEKGLGGWNNTEVRNQGGDALGGWHGRSDSPEISRMPSVALHELNPPANYGGSHNVPLSPGFHLPMGGGFNSGSGYQRV